MFDLIKKDILVTIKSDRQLLFRYILTLLICYTFFNPIAYFAINVFMSYVILINTFAYDYEDNAYKFIMSMPINKDNLVYSKYILSIALIFTTTIINNIIFEILSIKIHRGAVLNDVLVSLILYLLIVSVVLPIHFKFKDKKVKFIFGFIALVFILFQVGAFLMSVVDHTLNNYTSSINLYSISFGAIVIFILSMFLSLQIIKCDKGGKKYE